MILLGTLVTVGKEPDKPLHGKNGCGEESANRKGAGRHRAGHALPHRNREREEEESRLPSRQDFEAFFKAVGLERLFPFLVVVRIVGVEPIALGIDMEIGDLREFRRLN
jgi:hypothetical protein